MTLRENSIRKILKSSSNVTVRPNNGIERNCEGVKQVVEITEDYFMFLVGEINRGTSSKKVHRVLQINDRFKYFLC